MKYLKTFFITIILFNMGTIFNEPEEYIAYTTEKQTEVPTESEKKEETTLPQETAIPKEEKSALQEWNDHLAAISDYWDKANNLPKDEWKTKAFDLAGQVLEKDKGAAETLKSAFVDAINTQATGITQAISDLIQEFNNAITAKLSSLESQESKVVQEKKETVAETPQPSTPPAPMPESDVIEGLIKELTGAEAFPTGTTVPSETAITPQEQAGNKLEQWNELISKVRKSEGDRATIKNMLYTLNNLAPQLVSSGKKTRESIQQEYLEALKLASNKLDKVDLKYMEETFKRALSPEEYQEAQWRAQEEAEERSRAEQKRLQEETQKSREETAKKREKELKEKERQVQAALKEAQKRGDLSEEKMLALQQQVEDVKQRLVEAETQQRAKGIESGFKVAMSTKQKKAKAALSEAIAQPSAEAKKLAAEQKAASEQGFFGKAVQMVTNWWSGTTPTTTPQELILLEEQQEIKRLTEYLDALETPQEEQEKIIHIWKTLQQKLYLTPQFLEKNRMDLWITAIKPLLKDLVLTYHIISIEDARLKMKNVLSLFSTDKDSSKNEQIIKKIEAYLKEKERKQDEKTKEKENEKLERLRQKEEKEEQERLIQQNIKNEENRIKAEQEKLALAASDYKNEKQQWKQFLTHLSQHKQATLAENNAHTLNAIKKSHSLFNLATIVPSKNQHVVAQKLKQKFAIALLQQQKTNENKVNIHHHMDQFNKAINKLLE